MGRAKIVPQDNTLLLGYQKRWVLDQSRIKDLRTNVEISNTQKVLDGDLDPFINASLNALKRGELQ